MKGHAPTGSDRVDPSIDPYRLPLAWQKQKAANDNRPSLKRRVLRLIWIIAMAAIAGWVAWTAFR